jgi:hypothetical protein
MAAAWNDCLDSARFPTHYTSPAFFKENYVKEKNPFAVLAVDAGIVTAVVTGYFDQKEMNCGTHASPHICVRDGVDLAAAGSALAQGLQAHAPRSTKFINVFAWGDIPGFQTAGFRVRTINPPLCTILLDLSKGKDQLFRECSETRRNKIRRAIRAGVHVTEMNVETEFKEYYELYRHWCGYKNVACHPYDLQRSVFTDSANRLVLVARHEGHMVGVSTFRFRRPGVIEYAANVSRREESKVRQNDLLLWRGVEWAAEQGEFSTFSMAGAHFFLQKFGGQMHVTFRYSLDRTILRRRDAVDRIRSAVTRVYRSLPPAIRLKARKLLKRTGEVD